MFMFGFSNYMQHAFPMDDLRPISCGGHNTQGGIANTLVDSLDALMVRDITKRWEISNVQEYMTYPSKTGLVLHLAASLCLLHAFDGNPLNLERDGSRIYRFLKP